MNLKSFMEEMAQKTGRDFKTDASGTYLLPIDDTTNATLSEMDHGFFMHCDLGECPVKALENFFSTLLHANLLGQGTSGATLALSEDGERLTLHWKGGQEFSEPRQYSHAIEDFCNACDFWKNEALQVNK